MESNVCVFVSMPTSLWNNAADAERERKSCSGVYAAYRRYMRAIDAVASFERGTRIV
jgi:hypothetical protein